MKYQRSSMMVVLAFALFSIAALQAITLTQPQVLGEQSTAVRAPSISCTKLAAFYHENCSNPQPSLTPVPTSICHSQLSTYNLHTPCDNTNYRYVQYVCTDGRSGELGGTGSCKSSSTWIEYVRAVCCSGNK